MLACSVHVVRGRFGRLLWDSIEIARRTSYTEHASKKIRPSKILDLYISQRNFQSRPKISSPQCFYLRGPPDVTEKGSIENFKSTVDRSKCSIPKAAIKNFSDPRPLWGTPIRSDFPFFFHFVPKWVFRVYPLAQNYYEKKSLKIIFRNF